MPSQLEIKLGVVDRGVYGRSGSGNINLINWKGKHTLIENASHMILLVFESEKKKKNEIQNKYRMTAHKPNVRENAVKCINVNRNCHKNVSAIAQK